jgi:molybdopterin synthase catalytic subunit
MGAPPQAQPAGTDRIEVSPAVIDPASVLAGLSHRRSGAVCLFLGTVRDHAPGREGVTHLEYEAYEEMVERRMGEVVAEARRRWPLLGVAVVHRLGTLDVGEVSVCVAVSAPHRDEAFAAARFLIDEVKARAPIWKKEHWLGGAEWVRPGEH